jgi:plasmid stabilization system protein ParE
MSRVSHDIESCVDFVSQSPNGNPVKREQEIFAALDGVYQYPKANRVQPRRRLDFRKRSVAQFVIVYVYFEPNDVTPKGIVSIRAVRHRRVRDMFKGVREPVAPYTNTEPLNLDSLRP